MLNLLQVDCGLNANSFAFKRSFLLGDSATPKTNEYGLFLSRVSPHSPCATARDPDLHHVRRPPGEAPELGASRGPTRRRPPESRLKLLHRSGYTAPLRGL